MKIPAFDSVKHLLIPNDTFSQRQTYIASLKGQEISYFNKLHICSKIVNNVSLLSHTSAPSNISFCCSLVRFTIKNTIYSVIFRLVGLVFHLLFRYFNLLRKYDLDFPKHCVFTSWPCPSVQKTSEILSKGQITCAA